MTHPVFYILRHGETVWNAQGRLQGHFDSPLTETGTQQAKAQGEILRALDLTGFKAICSPQGRALETARIALGSVDVEMHQDARLSEIGLGAYAGEYRDALMARAHCADGFDLYEIAPGGEGFAGLESRIRAFLADQTDPAVLVTHGITSRMLRCVLTGVPRENLREIGGGQGVVYRVEGGNQTCLKKST